MTRNKWLGEHLGPERFRKLPWISGCLAGTRAAIRNQRAPGLGVDPAWRQGRLARQPFWPKDLASPSTTWRFSRSFPAPTRSGRSARVDFGAGRILLSGPTVSEASVARCRCVLQPQFHAHSAESPGSERSLSSVVLGRASSQPRFWVSVLLGRRSWRTRLWTIFWRSLGPRGKNERRITDQTTPSGVGFGTGATGSLLLFFCYTLLKNTHHEYLLTKYTSSQWYENFSYTLWTSNVQLLTHINV